MQRLALAWKASQHPWTSLPVVSSTAACGRRLASQGRLAPPGPFIRPRRLAAQHRRRNLFVRHVFSRCVSTLSNCVSCSSVPAIYNDLMNGVVPQDSRAEFEQVPNTCVSSAPLRRTGDRADPLISDDEEIPGWMFEFMATGFNVRLDLRTSLSSFRFSQRTS